MYPGSDLYNSIANRLASDTAVLGIATFLAAVPITAPYVPGVNLTVGSLTLGTGTIAKKATTVVPVVGIDPVSGQWKILVPPPAGGWVWNYDGVTPAPIVTIYGYACIDAVAGAKLMGVTTPLPAPVVLAAPGLVVLDELSFLLLVPPLQ